MMNFKGLCVVEISGESCANCFSMMKVLNNVLKDKDVNLIHIEIDENQQEFIKQYDIDRVPTIMVMLDNIEIARCRGYQPEEIISFWLEDKIAEAKERRN